MSLSDFAAVGEAIGGIAVLVTLLYLVISFTRPQLSSALQGTESFSLDAGTGLSLRLPILI